MVVTVVVVVAAVAVVATVASDQKPRRGPNNHVPAYVFAQPFFFMIPVFPCITMYYYAFTTVFIAICSHVLSQYAIPCITMFPRRMRKPDPAP